MAQVDSKNSTAAPVDPTRRRFLSTAAGAAGGSAALALAGPPALAADDPVFALIEAHKAAEAPLEAVYAPATAAHSDAALIELGAEYERLLAIEQPLRAESDRLWEEARRLALQKVGIDPDDEARFRAVNECYDEWIEAGRMADKETGYDKAWGKTRRASNKTFRVGRKILKIEPATVAGLFVRVRVIETHDEICRTEPLEALLAEIRGFAKRVLEVTS